MRSYNNQNESMPLAEENNHINRRTLWVLLVGMGFMLVEISTIQRFILFLGQPVLSLSVLLFSLLVGAGIGSIYSGRFASEKIPRVIAAVSMAVVAVLLIYAFSLSFILEQLLGLGLAVRLLATVVMLTPLGFIMGFIAGGDTNVKVTNIVRVNNIKA